jgi:hypothetical protein
VVDQFANNSLTGENMTKRAERRHQEIKRKVKKRKEVEAEKKRLEKFSSSAGFTHHRTVERVVGKNVATPCMCSNPLCCGNPRRTIGRKIEKVSEKKKMKDPEDWGPLSESLIKWAKESIEE